ncbi:START domain-containing protein [Ekhidna sp.]|uniref:START domain-containing protein n=1 Tax=Ekhidna sp. TaxID=2608089 RepID=UPI00329A4556
MIYHKTLLLLLSVLTLPSIEAFPQTSWEIDKRKDGIVVYTRAEKGSEFKSFKAFVLVEATTDEVIRILKNADSYAEWYGYTQTSKLLKRDENIQFNYVETIFPWPFKNRDMVYRMSINSSNPNETVISLEGIPNYMPEKKGIVRMKKAEGYILLKPLELKTEVTYVFHSEPGDNIPSWIANNSIAELPYKTLDGLREILNGR